MSQDARPGPSQPRTTAPDGLRGAAMVTRDGSPILRAARGPADVRTGAACTPDTRFQISSISKQFAAVAVLLLAERGALKLDDPITRWFPHGPAVWQAITVHHLLTHTSGIGHWSDIPGFAVSEPMDLDERLALFQRAPLLTEPGSRWRYSSPGYLIVGHIAKQAAGRPYADFLADEIFTPLGMTSTFAGSAPLVAGIASGHRDGSPVPPWDLAAMAGTGDVWSTVADLADYTTAFYSGAVLSAGSRQALIARHVPLDAEPTPPVIGEAYGYGVFIGSIAGRKAYFHPGDNPGYFSFNAWLPDDRTTITVLTDDETTDMDQVVADLLSAAV